MIGTTELSNDNRAISHEQPWLVLIRQRWDRLQRLIADEKMTLRSATLPEERQRIEDNLGILKRASLTVWLDGRREGIELQAAYAELAG